MRQIVAYVASSVDGYIAGPGDDMGWLPDFHGDATGYHEFFRDVGAIVMGRRTYQWIREHGAWPYGDIPCDVLSTSLPAGPVDHATVTPGPVTDLAVSLRQGEGTAWLMGGGGLFTAFASAALIDLWIVTVIPVMLGGGVPLFPSRGEAYQLLELAESRTLPGGSVQLRYRPRA